LFTNQPKNCTIYSSTMRAALFIQQSNRAINLLSIFATTIANNYKKQVIVFYNIAKLFLVNYAVC